MMTQSLLTLSTKCHPVETRDRNWPRTNRVRGAQKKAHYTGQGRPQEMLWGGLNAETESWSVRRKRKGNEKPY